MCPFPHFIAKVTPTAMKTIQERTIPAFCLPMQLVRCLLLNLINSLWLPSVELIPRLGVFPIGDKA